MAYRKTLIFKNTVIGQTLKVVLELELKGSYDLHDKTAYLKEVFSAAGSLYDNVRGLMSDRHLITAGQCLDVIPEFSETLEDESKKELNSIYELWKKYHLNDMHADCEHDTHGKVAGESITLYTYSFKGSYFKPNDKLELAENNSLLKNNIKIPNYLKTIKDKYRLLFTTEYPLSHFPKKISKLCELSKTEAATRGWIRYDEVLTPSGILCKPCPVCGYKYGTAWNYRPIPNIDLKRIYKLMDITESEVHEALKSLANSLKKRYEANNK